MNLCPQIEEAEKRGFTLVELMVVIAVLAIVTTVAIPGIRNARKRANEASAIASLKIFLASQKQYRSRYGVYGTVLDLEAHGMVDDVFDNAEKSGYIFLDASAPTDSSYSIRANPQDPGASGDRFFYLDSSGVIRFADGVPAAAVDPPLDA